MAQNDFYNITDDNILDRPIDYVKLEDTDFLGIEVTKDILNIPEGQHLTDVVKPDFYRDTELKTIAINSSVGQGKSTFIIQSVKNYIRPSVPSSNIGHYTVIFAVPYKALIKQYVRLLRKELGNIEIPDYENLNNDYYDERVELKTEDTANNINYGKKCRVHVMTINCLIGNPGDKAMEQNKIKREYVQGIIDTARKYGNKIILVFDEIHDGVHNFRQDLMFNLWKFRTSNTLQKIFVLSATFNEASKTVVNYLAELTGKRLHIYESLREQAKENLSNLHLYLIRNRGYSFDNEDFVEMFEHIINEVGDGQVNILSYSKEIAIKLAKRDSIISDLLIQKGKNINLSVSEYEGLDEDEFNNVKQEGEYLAEACNIGTMFRTGISIEHEHSAFIIILPNDFPNSKTSFTNHHGIFSSGIISIVQALARVRKPADIYVITPMPTELIIPEVNDSPSYIEKLPDIPALEDLKEGSLDIVLNDISEYSEISLNQQRTLMYDKYKQMYDRVIVETEWVNDLEERGERKYLPFLKYPSFDEFMLKWGEKYLYSKYAIFGKDLSSYMIWAAFNNQFVNCKLSTIITRRSEEIYIEQGKLHSYLYDLFTKIYSPKEEWSKFETCDYNLYKDFLSNIFSNSIHWPNYTQVFRSNPTFQQHVITFLQRTVKGNTRLHDDYYEEDAVHEVVDKPFKGEDYLLCCIANSIIYSGEEVAENTRVNNLIEAYKHLYEIRRLFIERTIMEKNDGRKYVYRDFSNYPDNTFNTIEKNFIIQTVNAILKDMYYAYFRKFSTLDTNNKEDAINKIYKELKKTFFKIQGNSRIELPIPDTTQTQNVNISYIEVIDLPQKRSGINLLYKYEYVREDNYENEVWGKEVLANETWDENITTDWTLDNLTEEAKATLKAWRESQEE